MRVVSEKTLRLQEEEMVSSSQPAVKNRFYFSLYTTDYKNRFGLFIWKVKSRKYKRLIVK